MPVAKSPGREFCSLWWDAEGYSHACLRREGHDPPHECYCDYPGGDHWTGPVFKTAAALFAAREARHGGPVASACSTDHA